jgi:hypothetical protein
LKATESTRNIIFSFVLSIFISTFLVLFAGVVMQFNYKMLIFVLSMPIILRFLNNIMTSFFFRTAQYFDLLKIVIVNFIIILVSGSVMAKYFGLIGLAWASLIGEIYLYYRQKEYIRKKLNLK